MKKARFCCSLGVARKHENAGLDRYRHIATPPIYAQKIFTANGVIHLLTSATFVTHNLSMAKKKTLTDRELVAALGGNEAVAARLKFRTSSTVRNWFHRTGIPWYWRKELEGALIILEGKKS